MTLFHAINLHFGMLNFESLWSGYGDWLVKMGSKFNKKLFRDCVKDLVEISHEATKSKGNTSKPDKENSEEMNKLESQVSQETIIVQAETTTLTDRSCLPQPCIQPSPWVSLLERTSLPWNRIKRSWHPESKIPICFLTTNSQHFLLFFLYYFLQLHRPNLLDGHTWS